MKQRDSFGILQYIKVPLVVLTFSVRLWAVSSLRRSTGLENISSADIGSPQAEHKHYLRRIHQQHVVYLYVVDSDKVLRGPCVVLLSILTGFSPLGHFQVDTREVRG